MDVASRPPRLRIGFFPAPRLLRLTVPGAPGYLRGLRALFVSDVHLRGCVPAERLDALIAQIESAEADLLLLGGDYAETPGQCARFFKALERVSPRLGGFAVPGNNDRAGTAALREMAAGAGMTLLCNEHRRIPLSGGALEIGGCDDHKYGSPRTDRLFSDAPAYRILLSHFPVAPDCDCELMLSGHTHAGQCRLFGCTPYAIGFERRYRILAVHGWSQVRGARLLVGSGVGVSRVPLRLNAEPQIYLLEFSR